MNPSAHIPHVYPPWPEDDKPASFDELTAPIRAAIDQAYGLAPKDISAGIPWTGLDVGDSTKACSPSPDQTLNPDSLAYHAERGRDALDVIIMIAVQLGIEQGRRMEVDGKLSIRQILERLLEDTKRPT